MRYLIYLTAAAGLLRAQPTIGNLQSDAITRSVARVGFNVSGSGNYYVQYGLTAAYGYRTQGYAGSTNLVDQITGMAPATTYNWRICNDDYTPPAGCSSNQTLTTAADTQEAVATAVLPALMNTAYPAITGSVLYVNATCSNLAVKLAEIAALDGNLNHELRFPLSTVCVGPFELPAKTGSNPSGGGYVILRPDVPDTLLPPKGTSITRDWEGTLPLFATPAISDLEAASNPESCSVVEYYWDTSQGGANKYKACLSSNVWSLVSASAGYTTGSGAPAGSCPIQGRYYFNTAGAAQQSLYRCVTINGAKVWLKLRPGGGDDFSLGTPYGGAVKGYRFVGLRFQPGDMDGSTVPNLLSLGRGGGAMANMIVDRCIFYTGNRSSSIRALDLNGAGAALIDSYIDLRVAPTWAPYNPEANMFAISVTSGAGPFKIVNNYIRGVGLLLFVNDNDGVVPRDDFEIRRNTFTYNDEYRCGSPTSDGICRDVRAPVEFKRGRRVWMDGNLFENYWATVGTYPAIIVSPRASGSLGFDGNTYQVRDFTITNNIFRKGTGFLEVWSGDNQGYRNTLPTERFTIRNNLFYEINNNVVSNYAGYNDARGQIVVNGGISDMIFEHNTVYNNTGSGPSFLHLSDQRTFAGLSWRSNILWLNRSGLIGGSGLRYGSAQFPDGTSAGSANATLRLNKTAMRVPNPVYQFTHNAIVAGTTGDTAAERPGYPIGNYWPGDNTAGESALQFTDAANGNFRLNPASPYRAGAASAGADGADLGVDVRGMDQAAGVVTGVRVLKTGRTQAIIRYGAPDGDACGGVDVSATPNFASVQRFTDGGGSRDRTVLAAGLTPGTLYFYRVMCAGSKSSGTFPTSSATASGTSMTLRLRPLSGSGVATASVTYGPTAALGTASSAVACGTECVVTIPVTLTQAVYWRVNYFTLSQGPAGASRVEVSIP